MHRLLLLIALAPLGVWASLHDTAPVLHLDEALNELCARAAASMLNVLGCDCIVSGSVLVTSLNIVRIEHGCGPISALAILLPIAVAWTSRPTRNAIVLAIAVVAFNQLRISALLILADAFPDRYALLDGIIVRIPFWLGSLGVLYALARYRHARHA
jgi:exosortase/archaeosortase family protein